MTPSGSGGQARDRAEQVGPAPGGAPPTSPPRGVHDARTSISTLALAVGQPGEALGDDPGHGAGLAGVVERRAVSSESVSQDQPTAPSIGSVASSGSSSARAKVDRAPRRPPRAPAPRGRAAGRSGRWRAPRRVGRSDDLGGQRHGIAVRCAVGPGTSVSRTSGRRRAARRAASACANVGAVVARSRVRRAHQLRACSRGAPIRVMATPHRRARDDRGCVAGCARCRRLPQPPPAETADARPCRTPGAGPPHAGLVHAPGGPLAAGVPRRPRGHRDARVVPATRTWSPRSRCSRSAATASTPPSSSPTSSCRSRPSGSTSTSSPARGPVIAEPIRARPTSTGSLPADARPRRAASPRRCARWSPSSAAPRSSGSPAPPSPWPPTSSRAARRKDHESTKALMHADPEPVATPCCDRLAQISGAFLRAQVEAGASVVQLFDSWVGALSRADYAALRRCRTRATALARSPTSTCPASTSASAPASCCALMGEAGADVVGVDCRVSARPTPSSGSAPGYAVQGNLDPALLFAPWAVARARRRAASSRGARGARATSSTSATACCRTPTPTS